MEIFKHLLRTLALMAGLGAVWGILFVAMLYTGLVKTALTMMMLSTLAFIYFSARWHAYWAPIADTVNKYRWIDSHGEQMETLVENAVMQVGSGTSKTLRVSFYNRTTGKRLRRIMIGDSSTFCGARKSGLWFFIHDRSHARKDGIVCIDRKTGDCLFYQPKKQLDMDDEDALDAALVEAQNRLSEAKHHQI
ncbi:hypothetical protein SAMN06265222_11632 [Neorhodopirellula lusitana]|uniref:Uncharacterized protein n=1 Tax=Neorhodopirellula lusitana TaxID=445327 RepID=A0ABY1QMA1_9BACT|nr:hypothetical protein [Neorhodopirellula lusitana]SMP73142.1 hypothetical protein SAMN06265222_11632 [Neorhodopirellula lusitana]